MGSGGIPSIGTHLSERLSGLPGLVGAVTAGAVAGALLAWIGSSAVQTAVSPSVATALGAALGGGIGSLVSLVDADDASPEDDAMTVEMDDRTPEPQPTDLFAEHPDPLLYYADDGNGPVVRAANSAFEDTFGVPAAGVTDAALEDALMAAERTDEIVATIRDSDPLDAVVPCETPDGDRRFRLQRIGSATDGYVRYLPHSGDSVRVGSDGGGRADT